MGAIPTIKNGVVFTVLPTLYWDDCSDTGIHYNPYYHYHIITSIWEYNEMILMIIITYYFLGKFLVYYYVSIIILSTPQTISDHGTTSTGTRFLSAQLGIKSCSSCSMTVMVSTSFGSCFQS